MLEPTPLEDSMDRARTMIDQLTVVADAPTYAALDALWNALNFFYLEAAGQMAPVGMKAVSTTELMAMANRYKDERLAKEENDTVADIPPGGKNLYL